MDGTAALLAESNFRPAFRADPARWTIAANAVRFLSRVPSHAKLPSFSLGARGSKRETRRVHAYSGREASRSSTPCSGAVTSRSAATFVDVACGSSKHSPTLILSIHALRRLSLPQRSFSR